jgi:hypothetical protein
MSHLFLTLSRGTPDQNRRWLEFAAAFGSDWKAVTVPDSERRNLLFLDDFRSIAGIGAADRFRASLRQRSGVKMQPGVPANFLSRIQLIRIFHQLG